MEIPYNGFHIFVHIFLLGLHKSVTMTHTKIKKITSFSFCQETGLSDTWY
jgi:hypothetical protein